LTIINQQADDITAVERDRLIGRVGVLFLEQQLAADDRPGTARFIVDCLSPAQTAAIALGILSEATLARQFEIKLPRHFVEEFGLPAEALTDERATYYRNAQCDKAALLLANTGDDEQQSLNDVTPIGAADLLARPELWVAVAAERLPLIDEHRRWWIKALTGLQELRFVSLDRYAEYVLATAALVDVEGLPIVTALGAALPALRLPKDSHYFDAIADRLRSHASKWRTLFTTAHEKRACYLSKLNPGGVVLSESDLRAAFDKVRDTIPESRHQIVQEFIAASGGWTDASKVLSHCEWEEIRPLFDGLKREKVSLGEATLQFYADRDPELLTDDEREYLRRLVSRRTTISELDDDKQFYNDHRDELREDRKLKAAWDRFLFGVPLETSDFLQGLVSCIEGFPWDSTAPRRKLTISCERRFKKDLKDLNIYAGMYFARRYAGLKPLFGRDVQWSVGELFNFPELLESWRSDAKQLTTSEAKAALQLKFTVELLLETSDRASECYSAQFVWRYDPQVVSCEFAHDWSRLVEHPLVYCRIDREPTSAKNPTQSVDIWDVRTLMAAYGQDRGSFVAPYKASNDLAECWRKNLREAIDRQWVSRRTLETLTPVFDKFVDTYRKALVSFFEGNFGAAAVDQQLDDYGLLLEAICREAKGDRARQSLLRPVLELGTVAVHGGRAAAIVAPWHPLRLAAIVRKAKRVAELLHVLIRTAGVSFGDPRLFFRELEEQLRHPYYPEVALGWHGDRAELLGLADVVGDYSLHESPVAADRGGDDTNENPTEGATRVVDLVQRYLKLQPHEKTNLSVVLYNCDSPRLPMAVVDRMGDLQNDEEDVRCQVVLRHRDARQLRSLYEQIVDASDASSDAFVASEASQDFMARLRIGIMADQAPAPDPRDGCPIDIVFSQDVIARHARLEWYPVDARPAEAGLNPAQWSRRRPSAIGDMKSVVYLCCPVQCPQGWAYLTSVATFFNGDWDGDTNARLLPTRQLDFQDPTTATIFEETHNLGTWVANYDELLDRRQLVEQGVRVIRYKQSETQGRNLVISSRAPLGLLLSMVLSRLRDLNTGLTDGELIELSARLISDANELSGDIVLRAAKRGRSASELIGLVLSCFLVRHELGADRYAGWYFLDDYAGWLGQKEEQIADFMALSPSMDATGRRLLEVVIGEAKYIDAAAHSAKRKESYKQLRDTLRRIAGAVLPTDENARLDRDVWLARLSDLLVDGVRFPAGASLDLPEWRRAIREGRCDINVRGYSHVFVSTVATGADISGCVMLPPTVDTSCDAYQEVFSCEHLRRLIREYHLRRDPTAVRIEAGGDGWGGGPTRRPEAPTTVLTRKSKRRDPEPEHQPQGSASGERPTEPAISSGGADQPPDDTRATAASPENSAPKAETTDAIAAAPTRWAYAAVEPWLASAPPGVDSDTDEAAWLRHVEVSTKAALQQFQLQAKLLRSVLTPNAALLKFQGSANLTVDQVLRRRSEFLTTHGLQIIGVQPEPGVIALSIARPHRQTVWLRKLWQRWTPESVDGNQALLIGVREDDGGLLMVSPGQEHAPHTLIAGSTGSGKSVLMQNILLSIVATNRSDQARITLIDPKQGVDYFAFEKLPHLQQGIIDSQDVALARINALITEMDARYTLLRQARASNLRVYNERASPASRLPTLWLIHDEFAEWMLDETYKEHVASAVGRLGVKARAAGIHLVFAAQRPEAAVMPMQLRANLGNRLILRVDSEGTSEIALGEKGAERLLGRGHMLAKLEGSSALVFGQVPYVPQDEIEHLVDAITEEDGAS
jgi:S-DNA-T family DNA segregation ATPase FtsK/SpoIIIE